MKTLNHDSHVTSGKIATRLSNGGKWRSFPQVQHLLRYTRSGTYFARIKIKGKTIRESYTHAHK
jgi:hypothetical protein